MIRRFVALLILAAAPAYAQTTNLQWPGTTSDGYAVDATDTFRIKAWNSWPQAEQIVAASPTCNVAGPENFQAKVVIKFQRDGEQNIVTSTKIMSMDNDRSSGGFASAPVLATPFGRAAGKGRTVTDASSTLNTKSISSCTVANPTVCLTSVAHGLTTGDMVVISASTTTPSLDGIWYVTVTDTTHVQIALNVTNSGTATLNASKTVTSATAGFTAQDLGKNITLTGGATTCTLSGDWGTGGPSTTASPCQGPKMPGMAYSPTLYQGAITSVTNSTTVVVKPSMSAFPTGTSTLSLEPVLLADQDGRELGRGTFKGLDINYWQAGAGTCTQKRGQSFFEAEINRLAFNGHEGVTLIKQYMEPSGHLSWPVGLIASGKVDGRGYTRMLACTDPAANAEVVCTVPPKAHWKVLGFTAALTTDANAANRTVSIAIKDSAGNNVVVSPSAVVQAASIAVRYSGIPAGTASTVATATGSRVAISLPVDIQMTAGQTLETTTQSRQVGDDFSVPFVWVEEWIEE